MNTKVKLALTPLAISAALAGQTVLAQNATSEQHKVMPPQTIVQEMGAGLIIKPRATMTAQKQQSMASSKSMQVLSAKLGIKAKHKRFNAQGSQIVEFEQEQTLRSLEKMSAQLMATGEYEFVEPNAYAYPTLTPNDTRLNDMWGLINNTTGIRAQAAWDDNQGEGVTVAVIDTGYRPHADLAGNIVGGYDFVSDSAAARDGNGRDSDARDEGDWFNAGECGRNFPVDSSWHGTHVAGTISALGNNNRDVVGVAYKSKSVPVRVLAKCGGTIADIADGMIWAAGGSVPGVPANPNPAKVLNLSLGGAGSCGSTYQNAVNSARANGAVVVIAAGNSNVNVSNARPANCNGVIAVAAIDSSGNRSIYGNGQASNFGDLIDIAAPGSQILSTLNSGSQGPSSDSLANYGGTSMATPHVAGVAALMLAKNPALTPDQIESIIKSTARPFLSGSTCSVSQCGDGMLDAAAAVAAAGGGNPPPPGGNSLTKGVAKTGLSGAQGSETRFTFDVPAGASNVTFNISGGTGDADLYVKFGSEPTVAAGTTGQCRPWRTGNVENCDYATTQAGTYHVMLHGYGIYSGVSLIADYDTSTTPPGGNSFENTTNVNIPDNNATGVTSSINSTRTGQAGTVSVEVKIVHTYIGDLIVDVLHPDGTVYNVHNRAGGSADNINQTYSVNAGTKASNGEWKLRVRDRAGADVGYIDSWKITF